MSVLRQLQIFRDFINTKAFIYFRPLLANRAVLGGLGNANGTAFKKWHSSGQRFADLAFFYLRLGIFARFGRYEERRWRSVLESISLNLNLCRLYDIT